MESSDHLNAMGLHFQNDEAIKNLTADNAMYDRIHTMISGFVEDSTIESCGIRTLKKQFSDYMLIIDAIKNVNNNDIAAYQNVNGIIGDEYLDGIAVPTREQHRIYKRNAESNADHYWSLYHQSCSSLTGPSEYLKDIAQSYDREAARHQAIIDECTRIIDKFDTIEISTKSLLTVGIQHRQQIAKAIEIFGKVFQADKYDPCLTPYRGGTYMDPADLSDTRSALEDLGVTEEQIANMMEKGFTEEEILYYVELCGPETNTNPDRTFLNALMSKDYVKAFQAYPADLSDDMYELLTEYSIRLMSYDEEFCYVGTDEDSEELLDFMNALWAADGCYPMVKIDDTPDWIEGTETECYLKKMSEIASRKVVEKTLYLSTMDQNDPGYKDAKVDFYRTIVVNGIWCTQYKLVEALSKDDSGLHNEVSDLSISRKSNAIVTFKISHYVRKYDEYKKESIKVKPLQNSDALDLTNTTIDLETARFVYENADSEGMELAKVLADGVVDQIELVSDAKYYAQLCDLLIMGNSLKKAKKEALDKANDDAYNKLFAGGTEYEILGDSETWEPGTYNSFCGMANPGAYKTIQDWLQNGVNPSFVKFGTESGEPLSIDEVYDDIIANPLLSDEEKELCSYILYGVSDDNTFKNLSKKFEDGTFNMDLFYDCIDVISDEGGLSKDAIITDFKNQSLSYGFFPEASTEIEK